MVEEESPGGRAPQPRSETGPTRAAVAVSTRRSTSARPTVAPVLSVVLTCLALTWLNPHVYLDTVFLLGSVANTHGDGRWAFALGVSLVLPH